MQIIETIADMREFSDSLKQSGKKIGFVPTMGFLHEGHLSLIGASQTRMDSTGVSIYVNPTQFNNPDDFQNYPKNLEEDASTLKKMGVDFLFAPKTEEMYRSGGNLIEIKIPTLMKNLCAPFRPGHFEGVLQIVSKLFHIVQPDLAVFGLKDYQQFLIIQKLVELLNFPVEILGVETLREKSGLAMSSRNTRLKEPELEEATLLYRALSLGKEFALKKKSDSRGVQNFIKEILLSSSGIQIEYIEVLEASTLGELSEFKGEILLAGAIYLGTVRLIDNIRFTI